MSAAALLQTLIVECNDVFIGDFILGRCSVGGWRDAAVI